MNEVYVQAQVYMQADQYDRALVILSSGLTQDPEDAMLLALLARCQNELGKKKEALATARKALAFEPENSFVRSALCQVLLDADKFKEAESVAADGIALDPEDADLLALRGIALINMSRHKEALNCAELALELEPDHEAAHWLRTQTRSLLRKGDAVEASIEHLARNPEGIAMQSHAFVLLRQGRTKEAYEVFLHALKNDPTDEGAREGLKEAIRGRFFLYRWLQFFSNWAQSLGRYWWIPFVVVVVLRRVITNVAEENPQLRPFLIPIGVALAFVIWGWVILGPVLNALLFFHPYGRYALWPSEKWTGWYWMASAVLLLAGGLAFLVNASNLGLGLLIYGVFLWILIGLASLFQAEKRRFIAVHLLAGIVSLIFLPLLTMSVVSGKF